MMLPYLGPPRQTKTSPEAPSAPTLPPASHDTGMMREVNQQREMIEDDPDAVDEACGGCRVNSPTVASEASYSDCNSLF